jgi:hypothetical protein
MISFIPNDFNWKIYILLNKDFPQNWKEKEAIHHYRKYGIKENRQYKIEDFNWKIYLKLNKDLNQNCSEEQATEHFLDYGISENRQYKVELPYDFNWKTYLKINQDFPKEWGEKEVIYHYKNYGFFEEDRIYKIELPNDFNWKTYLQTNEDLPKDWNEKEAIYHYKNYGVFQNITKHKNNVSLYVSKKYSNPSDVSLFLSKKVVDYSENSFLKINDILQNLPRGIHNNKEKISLDFLSSFILLIDFHNGGGGTTFFVESIISKYKKYQTFLIVRNFNDKVYFTINDEYEIGESYSINCAYNLLFNNKHKIEKIFFNHTLYHSNLFLESLFTLDKEVTTITHDFLLLFDKAQIEFNNIDNYTLDTSTHSKININKYDKIITQNIHNLFIFNNYIEDKSKIVITPLPDFKNSKDLINTSNPNIVVGIIGAISDCKGRIELEKIITYYKNSNIQIIIFGCTNIDSFNNLYPYKDINELNELLITHKPNVLIELSIWPETYSYTLTLSMLTQLPILYLKKNGYSVVEERLSKYTNKYSFSNIDELDVLVNTKKQDYFYTIEPVIYFNEFWDNYFITKKEKKTIKGKNKYDIKPYIIYFPQFHEIAENNISFYPGFSDIKNLDLLNKSNILVDIESPSLKEFNLENTTEYDYINKKSILQKQIDIIDEYNISGFAIYYYWFSKNTITNQNLIMQNVFNQFFDGTINMKNKNCFFIWANESWTNNPAFGATNERIETDYTNLETYENISENLLTYFKNDTYLKIDNKPVFELHHPWFMTEEQIDMFYNAINNKCIQNNFNGIHFIVNAINGRNNKYVNREHHLNYRKHDFRFFDNKLNHYLFDYKKYLKNDIKENNDVIETLVFDFDNRARLFQPDKLEQATASINNTEINKIIFMEKIINKYNKNKQSDVENILLINSWNEWGEKMTMEPSEQYGYYYLNLLNERLEYNTSNLINPNLINLENKNVILITSKVIVSQKKFNYIDIRSIYSSDERYIQTIETIDSIKKYIPNPYIVLFDNSIFTNEQYIFLRDNVDKFINITNDTFLNFYTDEYEYKAFADISQQLFFYDTFFKYVDIKSVKNFFKISGRYLINEQFNYEKFNNEDIIFKKNTDITDREYYYTCFYKINSGTINEYFSMLQQLFNNKSLYENHFSDIEVILPKIFNNKMTLTDNLGILQRIAVYENGVFNI